MEDDSIFRSLRIMTFRKNIGNHHTKTDGEIIKLIDTINKEKEVNLVVLNFDEINKISKKLEEVVITHKKYDNDPYLSKEEIKTISPVRILKAAINLIT